MKIAMITIEVIVSMLILFLVIITSTSTMKHLHILTLQKETYEELYIAVFNIQEKLSPIACKSVLSSQGSMNGYRYKAQCTKVKEVKNYVYGFDEDESGNIGDMFVQLYKVDLTLEKRIQHNYTYYVNVYKKSF